MTSSTPWYDAWRYASFSDWSSDRRTCIAPVVADNNRRCRVDNNFYSAEHYREIAENLQPGHKRDAAIRQFLLELCCDFGTHKSKLATDRNGVLTTLVQQYGKHVKSEVVTVTRPNPIPSPFIVLPAPETIEQPVMPTIKREVGLTPSALAQASHTREQVFTPFQPRLFETQTVRDDMLFPLDPAYAADGQVYCASWPGRPGYVKIGYTASSAAARVADLEKCFPGMKLEIALRFAFPEKIERLIHRELLKRRREIVACEVCDHGHIEWFEMSSEAAVKVIFSWYRLAQKEPLYAANRTLRSIWTAKIMGPLKEVTAASLLASLSGAHAPVVEVVDVAKKRSETSATLVTSAIPELLDEIRALREELRSKKTLENDKVKIPPAGEVRTEQSSPQSNTSTPSKPGKLSTLRSLQEDLFAPYAKSGANPFETVKPKAERKKQPEMEQAKTLMQDTDNKELPGPLSPDPIHKARRKIKTPNRRIKPAKAMSIGRTCAEPSASVSTAPSSSIFVSFPLTPPTTLKKAASSSPSATPVLSFSRTTDFSKAADLFTPSKSPLGKKEVSSFSSLLTPPTSLFTFNVSAPMSSNKDQARKFSSQNGVAVDLKRFEFDTSHVSASFELLVSKKSKTTSESTSKPTGPKVPAGMSVSTDFGKWDPAKFDFNDNPFLPAEKVGPTQMKTAVTKKETDGPLQNAIAQRDNDKSTQTEVNVESDTVHSLPLVDVVADPRQISTTSITTSSSEQPHTPTSPVNAEIDQMLVYFSEFMSFLTDLDIPGVDQHEPPTSTVPPPDIVAALVAPTRAPQAVVA